MSRHPCPPRSTNDPASGRREAPPPPKLAGETAAALRRDLAGYTSLAVDELLGPLAAAALAREELVAARDSLAGRPEPGALLARLFILGEVLSADEVARALPSLGLRAALDAYLIEPVPETGEPAASYRALVDLAPTGLPVGEGPGWIMSDLPETVLGEALPPWHVLGVGGASTTLHALLPRGAEQGSGGAARRALDLGTGSGIQALSLLSAADVVVGTDVSERALAFARANAELNGIPADRLELRAGSLFEPGAGEEFDLIVSNPPFVITPSAAYDAGLPVMEYRDGGQRAAGDSLVGQVVSGIGEKLTPGGRAIVLANWEVSDAQREFAAPLSWLAEAERRCGFPLDAWIVRREFQDGAEYAEMWLRDGGHVAGGDRRLREATYRAYLQDFASRNVAWIDFGYLLIARPQREATRKRGAGMREMTDLVGAPAPSGADLWRLFDVRRTLASVDDEQVAAARIRAASDVTIEHHFRVGASQPEVITATQGGGLHQVITCPTELAGLLSAADGSLAVEQIAGALAALLDTDPEQMRRACIAHARTLASLGMVDLTFA